MVSFFLPVVGRHNIIRHRIFNRYLPVLRYQENNLHHIGVGADDLHDTADAVSGDFDPVSDCGCFGDAWVLTNWETFAKNIVLLLAAIATFQWRKMLIRFVTRKMEWLISLYTIFFVFTLSFYCLDRLPVLDFRPYKIGQNIMKGMSIPEGAKPSVYESVFILKKNGKRKSLHWTIIRTAHGPLSIRVPF